MNILIKDNHITGSCSLAHPLAKPGKQNENVSVKQITNVPEGFPTHKLLILWSSTCDCTWLKKSGDPMSAGRFVFDFSELGEGKILLS